MLPPNFVAVLSWRLHRAALDLVILRWPPTNLEDIMLDTEAGSVDDSSTIALQVIICVLVGSIAIWYEFIGRHPHSICLTARNMEIYAKINQILEPHLSTGHRGIRDSAEWANHILNGATVSKMESEGTQLISFATCRTTGQRLALKAELFWLGEDIPPLSGPVKRLEALQAMVAIGKELRGQPACAGTVRVELIRGELPTSVFSSASTQNFWTKVAESQPWSSRWLRRLYPAVDYWAIITMEFAGDKIFDVVQRLTRQTPVAVKPFIMDQLLGLMVALTDLEKSKQFEVCVHTTWRIAEY